MPAPDIEVEDPALAAARTLLHVLDEDPPDVLVFGESTLTFVGPDEHDQRSLVDLIVEAVAPQSVFVVAGPGFNVQMHTEFVRLAATRVPRPVVLTTLYARGTLPAFLRHPVWGHRRQIELLTALTGAPVDEIRGDYEPPTPAEWADYEAMPYPTLVDDRRAIADFMAELRPPRSPFSAEHLRWLFEFHFGGTPDPDAVAAFTTYGRTLREAGYSVVAFQNPVSVAEAAGHLGDEFVARHRHHTDEVRDAFVAGYGTGAVIVESAGEWTVDDFVEPAVEHLTADARARLAAVIVDAIATAT